MIERLGKNEEVEVTDIGRGRACLNMTLGDFRHGLDDSLKPNGKLIMTRKSLGCR